MIVPLNEIKCVEEFVLLAEPAAGQEASGALSEYVRQTGREAHIYKRTDEGWVRH